MCSFTSTIANPADPNVNTGNSKKRMYPNGFSQSSLVEVAGHVKRRLTRSNSVGSSGIPDTSIVSLGCGDDVTSITAAQQPPTQSTYDDNKFKSRPRTARKRERKSTQQNDMLTAADSVNDIGDGIKISSPPPRISMYDERTGRIGTMLPQLFAHASIAVDDDVRPPSQQSSCLDDTARPDTARSVNSVTFNADVSDNPNKSRVDDLMAALSSK